MPKFKNMRRWLTKVIAPLEDEVEDDLIPYHMRIPLPDETEPSTLEKIRLNDMYHQAVLLNGLADAINSIGRTFGIRIGRLEANMGFLKTIALGVTGSALTIALQSTWLPMIQSVIGMF